MDIIAILAIISKAMTVIETAAAVGESIAPAITVVKNLVTGAQAGTVTDQQLVEAEAQLDALIADFNQPL